MPDTNIEIKTLMGYTIQDAMSKLDEALGDDAYSKVEGVPGNFTDIKPAWRDEYFNNIFGICGVGWWYEYDGLKMSNGTTEKGKTTYIATIEKLELFYRMVVNGEIVVFGPIPSAGINENVLKPEWAAKGAITSALGAAASRMGWQLSVYQKKRSHSNKGAEGDGAWEGQQETISLSDALKMGVNEDKEKELAARDDGVGTLARIALLNRYSGKSKDDIKDVLVGDVAKLFFADFKQLRAWAKMKEDEAFEELCAEMFEHKIVIIGDLVWVWQVLVHLANGSDKAETVTWYKAVVGNA